MKKNKYTAIFLALLLSGCSSIDSFNKDVGNMLNINDRTTASTVGGGIVGTATGCVVGVLSGNIAKGCIAGAAIGAAGGYAISLSEQLEEAKQLQQDIEKEKLKGLNSTIKSSPVDNSIETKTDRKLDEMVINIPDNKVYEASVNRILVKAAKISSASKKDVSITVYGAKTETQYMVNILKENISGNVKVYEKESSRTQIRITPIPEV